MLHDPSFVDLFLSLIISFLVQLQLHLFFSSKRQSRHTFSSSIMLYLLLGAERPNTQSYDSRYGLLVIQDYLGWPLRLGETLPLRTSNEKLTGWSAVSTRLPTLQHLLEKQVSSLQELCSTSDFLQTHLQESDFFVHEERVSQETCLVKLKAPMSVFYEEATSKSSTKKGILYAHDPEECKKGMLSDQPQLSCITSTALLCHWGQQSLEDMTSLGTDFETHHAIWQGYIEDPAAKDFVARKACTIACFEWVQGTQQSTLFTSYGIPWEFLTQAVLRSLAGLMLCKRASAQGFWWVRKVWFAFAQQTFAPENFSKRPKGGKSPGVSLLPGSR